MDIGAIKARIAELEQRKAERNALRGYRDLAYLDYMTKGDRSGFDRIDADEVAYRNMLAQQKFQEQQRALDRELSRELSNNANTSNSSVANEIANKYQLALTDYELADSQRDTQKPETLARLKRAAQMVNHYGSQLGFEPVVANLDTDSEPIRINKAIAKVKALNKLNAKNWTNEQKAAYDLNMSLIPDDDERKADLVVSLTNKGSTVEDKDLAEFNRLQKLVKDGKNLNTKQKKRYDSLKSKYGK